MDQSEMRNVVTFDEACIYDLNNNSLDSIRQIMPDSLEVIINRGRSEEIQAPSSVVREFLQKSSQKQEPVMCNPLKKLVSKQKNRFDIDGFNLDLTYITDQIIAMGYPAQDYEAFYRNSMSDVQRFFNQRHRDHYKIINLCCERKYDHSFFNGMVSEYPFEDHQPPNFKLIYDLCLDVDEWINKDKRNVIGIHCKAGKGRTGIMICCYLLYSRLFTNSYDAMRYYGFMRTKNKKGVTIPSQIRYILYFEKLLTSNMHYQDIPHQIIKIVQIKLITIPNMNYNNSCHPWIQVFNPDQEVAIVKDYQILEETSIVFHLNTTVVDDVRVICYNRSVVNKREKMFQFWFNTNFIEPNGILVIDKYMLDGAVKDTKHKIFSSNFRVELTAIPVEQQILLNL